MSTDSRLCNHKRNTFPVAIILLLAVHCSNGFMQYYSWRHSSALEIARNTNYVGTDSSGTTTSRSFVAPVSSFCAAIAISLAASNPAFAVSGGGLDFANLDLTGKDFSNSNYKGKDFTQVIAKGTTFENSNLVGCRFYKAFLVNANFKGADLRGASLEDTSMDGAVLDNANAAGAYFSASLLDAQSIAGADFSDAQLPPKLLARICEKENFAKGTNPTTGIETRDSLMCP